MVGVWARVASGPVGEEGSISGFLRGLADGHWHRMRAHASHALCECESRVGVHLMNA